MKVAFVAVNAKATGGAEESLALLLRNLPPSIEPVVVCFEDGPFVEGLRDAGIAVYVHPVDGEFRRTRREGSWLQGGLVLPRETLRLADALRSLAPDLIHSDTMKGHVLAIGAGRILGIPAMLHLRDMFDGNARKLLRFVANPLASDRVSVSRAVARWYGLPDDTVVYNPFDLESYRDVPGKLQSRAELGLPEDAPLVGMVGRINRWKGHDRFLRIIARLSRELPVHGVIVGEPRNRDYDFVDVLEAQIVELGLTGRVSFVPWQADPRMAFAALDVHVNCSVREPFGRTVVEAAACGVPSVCSNDGAFSEIFEPGDIGYAFDVDDEAGFSTAIATLLRREPSSEPIIKRLDRFSTSTHVAAMTTRMLRAAERR